MQLPALYLGNPTASQLLRKKVCKRCAPRNMLPRNQQRRHLRLCMVSSLLHMDKIRYNEPKHLKYIPENRGSQSLGTQNYLLLQETIRCRSFFNDDLPKKKRCMSLLRSAREFFCINTSLFCLITVAEREAHAQQEARTRLRKVVWWVLQNSILWILASRERGKKRSGLDTGYHQVFISYSYRWHRTEQLHMVIHTVVTHNKKKKHTIMCTWPIVF